MADEKYGVGKIWGRKNGRRKILQEKKTVGRQFHVRYRNGMIKSNFELES